MSIDELRQEYHEKMDRRQRIKAEVDPGYGDPLTAEQKQDFAELSDRCLELQEMIGGLSLQEGDHTDEGKELVEDMQRRLLDAIETDKRRILEYTQEDANSGLYREAIYEIDELTEG